MDFAANRVSSSKKGSVQRNYNEEFKEGQRYSKKGKDIISKNGSRTVLRSVEERVFQALQDESKTTQELIALQSDDVTKQAESEEWLDNLRSEVEDIVDSIEEYLESRADEPPSVLGEFSFVADVVDDKESRNSESSDDSQVESACLWSKKLVLNT